MMKKIFLLVMVLFAFVSFNNSFSQEVKLLEKPEFNGSRPVSVEVVPRYVPLYVVSDKELPSYFISNKIPESFPKYDAALTKEKNQIAALKWCEIPANRNLLTDDAKNIVDKKIAEFKEKRK